MDMDFDSQFRYLLELAVKEDGDKDITSESLFSDDEEREGLVISKEDGILCGLDLMEKITQSIDESLVVEPYLDEGDIIKPRMMVVGLSGKLISLLRVERIMLNFLSRLTAIASLTRRFVDAVDGTGAVILDTRKTIPGWRYLDKYAVRIGGGVNHRMDLEEVAIIKDVHVDAVGSVESAIMNFRDNSPDTPLIVEVRDLKEFESALSNSKSLTRIMLDNFSLDQMSDAVKISSGRVLLESSGNITLENARDIAETGVHFLSVGALTHSAKAFDFSFHISS